MSTLQGTLTISQLHDGRQSVGDVGQERAEAAALLQYKCTASKSSLDPRTDSQHAQDKVFSTPSPGTRRGRRKCPAMQLCYYRDENQLIEWYSMCSNLYTPFNSGDDHPLLRYLIRLLSSTTTCTMAASWLCGYYDV